MTIRPAQAGDYSEIYSLVQTAFATAKVSDGTEQDFVLELRRRDTYRPELCVRLEDRNRGLGGQLLREGGRRAAELGYNALFLVGDPDYYGRYGFQNAVSLGFQNASGVPDQFLLARGLTPDALRDAGGALALH